MKTLSFSILSLILLYATSLNAQSSVNLQLENTKKTLANSDDEKIHLHLDKPYYAAGDIIWLKAYVVNYVNNKPSSTSGILYADLINEKNVVTKLVPAGAVSNFQIHFRKAITVLVPTPNG